MDGTITWSPTTLWPPDHKMQTITIQYSDTDSDGDSIKITVGTISDNQVVGGEELNGSGAPTSVQGPDWSGTGNNASASDPGTATTTAEVRAERSGTDKAGRTYSIQVMCNENGPTELNQSGTATLTVFVPHDQGNN
jgi:hypothetical protein